MLTPGTLLQNRYEIINRLGGGGMGIVYLTNDTRLPGRRCAIKVVSTSQLSPQDRDWAISAFQQEARMLANLHHPGLASVTDFFPEGDSWYLVMDYIEGETLEARLQRVPGYRLSLLDTLEIMRQLCDVLWYLHSQYPPVVFRDLKPDNVMIMPNGQIKLIDFGIARFFKTGGARDTVNLGTPGYAAPEQYGGHGQSDPRSDIYSLGVMLHRMLTGYDPTQSPFNLPPARSLNRDIPHKVESVIVQATQMHPAVRFQSVWEFGQALFMPTQEFIEKEKERAQRQRRRRMLFAGVGCVFVLALITGGVVLAARAGLLASIFATSTPPPIATAAPIFTPTSTHTLVPTPTHTATTTRRPPTSTRRPPTSTPVPTPTRPPTWTPSPVPKPDLIIHSFGVDPAKPVQGRAYKKTYTIQNIGKGSSGRATLRVVWTDGRSEEYDVPPLAAGEKTNITQNVAAGDSKAGPYRGDAQIDVRNAVQESNESNNVRNGIEYEVVKASTSTGPLALTVAETGKSCKDANNYNVYFSITASGGAPPYTYYRDALTLKIGGPVSGGINYTVTWADNGAAVGTFIVVDSAGARVEYKFFSATLHCP